MKSLVIGMGIGQLYQKVLNELNFEVITADLNKPADYKFWQDAVRDHKKFDTVHICTPNFTHNSIAFEIAPHCRILFVEKPGLRFESDWRKLVSLNPNTRCLMVKNNMWRDNIPELKALCEQSNEIRFHWLNENRVPYPGSWFTNRDLAFGGVSRDLLPHLLSLFIALEPQYEHAAWLYKNAWQRWELKDLTDGDYGQIDHTGVYNVDDHLDFECTVKQHRYFFRSSWRTCKPNDIGIYFDSHFVELGLCPESAYGHMIEDCVKNIDNDLFWEEQLYIDCWIHGKINL